MVARVRTAAVEAARDSVPFLVITAIWIVVMLVIYGLFLVSIPEDVTYGPAVHASVFVPALIGFLSHALHQVLKTNGA